MKCTLGLLLSIGFSASALGATSSIINSKHNLSAAGPGAVRAASETEVCVFCHTPHKASRQRPLWNRNMPVASYQVYRSNSLQSLPGQPTGTSKMCLSCHDGTIALGSVLSRDQQIAMASGITTLPPGAANLGTDLRDDHPISFKYDGQLVTRNLKLKDPSLLPAAVKLDKVGELQCTACHDAHDNTFGKFLVMDNSASQLCSACHNMGATDVNGHTNCGSCHRSHSAPSGPYLLKAAKPTDTCLACHSGGTASPQGPNIAADIAKASNHDTGMSADQANPIPNHASCFHCHEPHTMRTASASPPAVPPALGTISGINAAGGSIPAAAYQYEVCFKCHADQAAIAPIVTRQIVQANTRLEFAPSAISYHPVEAAGKNNNVPSLKAPYTTASIIYCSDCHNSNTSKLAGGTGPNGVHGSAFRPLLVANYNTTDNISESASQYALCYRCHNRTAFINEGGPFRYHKKHIVDKKTPCSVCHDAHGISSSQGTATRNARLINFNTAVVRASSSGLLYYESTGTNRGRCYLTCHSKNHNPLSY